MKLEAGLWICLSAACLQAASPGPESADFFEMRIRPLLAKNCFACHTGSRMGGLQLDSRENILRGGKSGAAIVPGKPDESLLIQAVRRTHERLKMPPQGPLPDQDVTDLTAWVKTGAVWPETGSSATAKGITPEQRAFWAFQPVRKPAVPSVKDQAWPESPIDPFILSKLEEQGLKPAHPAGKRTLIRRVTFDLTGLPPAPDEVETFVNDSAPDAFAKVVDRLLASPRYGERWGRYWLDLARYADAKLGAFEDTPAPHSFRYRDWVIQAFNEDMPYDVFIKAQIAGDLMPGADREKLIGGLGFQALGDNANDQVDVTTRAFLGLTVACAQCHDHKYDPIPTKDYYSLLGVFRSSERDEYPLASPDVVKAYKEHQKKIDDLKEVIDEFVKQQSGRLSDILVEKTSRYVVAAWKVIGQAKLDVPAVAQESNLDRETLERWVQYLRDLEKEHPYLKPFYDLLARDAGEEEIRKFADGFQRTVLSVIAEKKGIDDRNYVTLGGAKGVKDEKTRQYANLEFLDVDKYYLWRDLCSESYKKRVKDFPGGVYYYSEKQLGRFLQSEFKEYLESKVAELAALKKALPPQYPLLYTIKDSSKPKNVKVAIRGEANNPGEEAPRRFLAILCDGEPAPFTKGSGRLELAEAIASPSNPLTARVMVNRIWELHLGQGIVRTPGNFGQLGDRPSHPELLDYLASSFIEDGWSIKKLHRQIVLSATYQLSAEHSPENFDRDPENRFLWRANLRPRLDAEALRDALLAVAGNLDTTMGGPAVKLDECNQRRTVYGFISRSRPDPTLAMFDFPNPNTTSEQRLITNSPVQRLFFLNSSFVSMQAKALAERLNQGSSAADAAKIRKAYLLLFSRPPKQAEIELGLEYLRRTKESWPQYAQVLLSSNEFTSVN